MGLESKARAWAHQRGLQRSRVAVAAYRTASRVRFRGWTPTLTTPASSLLFPGRTR